jgi:hypothetical protein
MGLARLKAGLPSPSKAAVVQAKPTTRPKTLRERFSKGTVGESADLERILALPRREKPDLDELVNEMTFKLKKPEGTQTLRGHQAWVLWEAPQVNGMIAPLATGAGKTLLGMLMPMCFPQILQDDGTYRPLRAVLFIPPDLRAQFAHDWEVYGKHWKLPNLADGKWFIPGRPMLHVVAYSELSHAKSTALLEQIKPDLIMGDEIGALRNFAAARTIRFLRFIASFPDTRFCGWDASILADSIGNFWHLLAIALDQGSPTPLEEVELRKWASALDPSSDQGYFMPGELLRFCEEGESPRSGFQRRLVDTKGVIATEENALGIPLFFTERRPPKMPEEIKQALRDLRRKPADGGWKRPDGEEFSEMTQVVACARQLASGLYLRWRFPKGEPEAVIDEWFLRRQNWNRELRAQLSSPQVHLDSPLLCENAARRWFDGGCTGCTRGPSQEHDPACREIGSHPLWKSYSYLAWRAVKETVYHETQVVWISDWLLQDAATWAREAPGIVWVDHPEFGHQLEKLTGFRYYGGGDEAAEEIIKADGATSIICSVLANKKGKNLQAFSRNLIVSFPASNDVVEQVCGRTYRTMQSAPQVDVFYYLHTPELENALEKAKSRATFVKEVMGTDQKLCFGKFKEPACG